MIVKIQKDSSRLSNKIIIYAIDAGEGDCILLHQLDTDVKILIDSGPSKGEGRLSVYNALSEILEGDNFINLALVTHNDDDHIGGFIDLIDHNIIEVDTFIFNDSSYIKKLFPVNDGKYSLRQDGNLQHDILKNKIKHLHNQTDSERLSSYSYRDFKFDFLSPNYEKLKIYNREIGKQETKLEKKKKFSKQKNIVPPTKEQLQELISELKENDIFVEDNRPANGTSLAFRLKIGTKRFLFLGDSHPSLVTTQLKKLEDTVFDLCKLSHHGSEKNTSPDLLSNIKCKDFLICSNGCRHGHPSLKTIARVLISEPKSKFYFSSDSVEIKNLTNSIPIIKEFAKSGYLKVEYVY
ncbi:ComEC/Rec2 family competence protein [Desulfotalea psychrophila]|uniref:Metallo-beta-lactamase domain-containing protein n=1 Tax=Desulfotalea psychrophila (strain LSv54 / DSM 12343) TaxID=177439 RepID=Q6AKU3_DESPS|nr:hypothetical protein [Desulfotalea psychrophila]CAG37032.1 hypothetical protein DP2303 [Desulfotalea psychrophila LSv54]